MNSDRTVLTDEMWARVAPLCPGQVTDPGRTAVDNRLFLEGVLWRFRTGTPWRDLPPHFGQWTHVFKRFRRWAKANLCERLFNELSGDLDLSMVSVDGPIMQAHQKASGAKKGDQNRKESVARKGD